MKRAKIRRAMREFVKKHWRSVRRYHRFNRDTTLVDKVKLCEYALGVKLERKEG